MTHRSSRVARHVLRAGRLKPAEEGGALDSRTLIKLFFSWALVMGTLIGVMMLWAWLEG